MSEVYSYLNLDLYYFTPFTLYNRSKFFGYINPMAAKYINFTHIFLVKGHYGYGNDTTDPHGWRALNKDEL